MKATALETSPGYYHAYINLVNENSLKEQLVSGGIERYESSLEALKSLGLKTYAEGKWTVNEIVQHCIDTERIFINRALRFLRNDKTNLPGYDHDAYVPASNANRRSLDDLLAEYKAVRHSSALFYAPLTQEELLRTGTANNLEISVLAIGYILVGHPTHHFNVIKERYLVL